MRTTFLVCSVLTKSYCPKIGQAEYLLKEMCIGAGDSANSSIIFHVRVFLSVLIFLYNFYHKFTKLNLYLLLIFVQFKGLNYNLNGISKRHKSG